MYLQSASFLRVRTGPGTKTGNHDNGQSGWKETSATGYDERQQQNGQMKTAHTGNRSVPRANLNDKNEEP